ncbi:MAG: fluoride efflux transporter CrcB [Magnetovibrionaceae bacterium]
MTLSLKLLGMIAAGGAIGAVLRYLLMVKVSLLMPVGMLFPWPTFAVNLLGAFLLGALIEVMALVWSPTPEVRAFLVIGLLGAFTTFSTFSMDLYAMIVRDQILAAVVYAMGSVLLCLAGFWLGLKLVRLGVNL